MSSEAEAGRDWCGFYHFTTQIKAPAVYLVCCINFALSRRAPRPPPPSSLACFDSSDLDCADQLRLCFHICPVSRIFWNSNCRRCLHSNRLKLRCLLCACVRGCASACVCVSACVYVFGCACNVIYMSRLVKSRLYYTLRVIFSVCHCLFLRTCDFMIRIHTLSGK